MLGSNSRAPGTLQIGIVHVFLLLWYVARGVLKLASAVARGLVRGLVACLLILPAIVLPRQVCIFALNVSHVLSADLFHSFEATVARVTYVAFFVRSSNVTWFYNKLVGSHVRLS